MGRPRVKRQASNMSLSSNGMDPKELGQLAHFMLSSSENDSESESDDDFKSRVICDSDVERRQTRSPSSASKNPRKKSPKKADSKPLLKKSGSKRSLESVLQRVSDLKKEKDEETVQSKPPKKARKAASPKSSKTLEKFFAAEMEMDMKKEVKPVPARSREVKTEPKEVKKSESSRKGRKSNTPRKIEIVSPEDTWEHSDKTVVDQNSTGGKDYLIPEGNYLSFLVKIYR